MSGCSEWCKCVTFHSGYGIQNLRSKAGKEWQDGCKQEGNGKKTREEEEERLTR